MKTYPHWQNLSSKLDDAEDERLELLREIENKYREWREQIDEISGIEKEDITAHARLYSEYKNFIQEERFDVFDRRGRLHSTALEEFHFHLFKNLVDEIVDDNVINRRENETLDGITSESEETDVILEQRNSNYLGKGDKTIDSLSLRNLILEDELKLAPSTTNQDFVIGREISTDGSNLFWDPEEGDETLIIPAVIIECKEYFDKTMIRRGKNEASDLTNSLTFQPHFYLVSEYIKVSDLDLMAGSDIENLYVLRKQQQTDLEDRRDNPDWPENRNDIDPELVWHMFQNVQSFLTEDSGDEILEKGRYY